jgi:hypothetical protein
MRKNLTSVLQYFAQFNYSPTFDEIHTFFLKKITRKELQNFIQAECNADKLIRLPNKQSFSLSPVSPTPYNLPPTTYSYTLPQYSIHTDQKSNIKNQNGNIKIAGTIQIYFKILSLLPMVRFVGVTGKSAMEGYRKDDDVDLFIITKSGFLWTTRFLVVFLAKLLMIHGGTGVCLNLFFNERDLVIPKVKHNMYVAHELLQMKPIIDKNNTYSALMRANVWVFSFFPNARIKKTEDRRQNNDGLFSLLTSIFYLLEPLARLIQLPIIKKNKTAFRITPTQLWLFKHDFEKKLKKKTRGR